MSIVHSQGVSDALLFSEQNLNGTARFSAMSGAFGALGGDFSAINVNPAGSAIFVNNQVSFTLTNFNVRNKSNYFDSSSTKKNNTIDLNQAGMVFVFNSMQPKSNWRKITFAMNYENTNNFNNSLYSRGINPSHSIDNYFLSYANANTATNQAGIPLGTLQNNYYEELNYADQQAYLGYWGQIITPKTTDSNNTIYYSNVPSGGNYSQENYKETTGYNGKLSFNLAGSFKDTFYFGANLNSHFTDYIQATRFTETNTTGTAAQIRNLQFDNNLHTFGNGFSLQLGTVAKLTKSFRVGLAYESPTWMTLNDELLQRLSTNLNQNVDSNILIIYKPYNLRTPAKWTGSVAYIFGKRGLLSLDYSLKNYSNTRFTPKQEFENTNNELATSLKTVGEIRLGAEYRIKQWSLRSGYRNVGSPYKDKTTVGSLSSFSGGLGYNFGTTKLDISYSHADTTSEKAFFAQGFTDTAQIRTGNNNVSVTFMFEL